MDSNTYPPLCSNGCNFYGSEENSNLCSKCYHNLLKKKIAESAALVLEKIIEISARKRWTDPSRIDLDLNVDSSSCTTNSNGDVKVKSRCVSCSKMVGLTGFSCRCGKLFCGSHRYPETHDCKVDWKTIGRKELEKQNPVCVAEKLQGRLT